MKIHLVKEKTIRNFVLNNRGSKIPFEEWLSKLKKADWNMPADIQSTFSTADILGKGAREWYLI
jgi:mRNA interferase HigB